MNPIIIILFILFTTSFITMILYDPLKILAYVSMGIALSSTSLIIYYRRLEFLAAESVHIALLAVTLGYILEYYTGISLIIYSLIIGLFLVYTTALLIKLGLAQEKASAIIIALVSALTVISIHFSLMKIPMRYSLSSLMLGDPLLLTKQESIIAILISVGLATMVVLFIRELIEISIDPVSASVLGLRTWFYEILVYFIVGVASVGLLRLAGYVMEHVLLLSPAIIASLFSNSISEHYLITVLLGSSLTSMGYVLSIILNTTPTGLTGLLLLIFLIGGYLLRGRE